MTEQEWLTPAETAALCKASVGSLVGWADRRQFPAPHGVRPKKYKRTEVVDWLKVNRPWVLGGK